jgi:hypothetical protein
MPLFQQTEIRTQPTLNAQKALAATSLDAAFSVALYYASGNDWVEATRYAIMAAAQFSGHEDKNALELYLENEFFTPFNSRVPLGKIITQRTDDPSLVLIPAELSGSQRLNNTDAKALALALAHNRSLNKLVLTNNDITAEGAVALAEALKTNTTLTSLDLAFNAIGDEGLKAFGAMLEVNPSLRTLRFRTSSCTDAGVIPFAKALRQNTSLLALELLCDKMTQKGAQAVRDALHENLALQVLDMKVMSLTLQQELEALIARNRCFDKAKAPMSKLKAKETPAETLQPLLSLRKDHEAIKDKVPLPHAYRKLLEPLDSMIALFQGMDLLNKAGFSRVPGALKPEQTTSLLALSGKVLDKFEVALWLDPTNAFAKEAILELIADLSVLHPIKDGPRDHLARLNFCSLTLEKFEPVPKDKPLYDQLKASIQSSEERLRDVIAASEQGVKKSLRMSLSNDDSIGNLDELYVNSPEGSPKPLLKKPEKPN